MLTSKLDDRSRYVRDESNVNSEDEMLVSPLSARQRCRRKGHFVEDNCAGKGGDESGDSGGNCLGVLSSDSSSSSSCTVSGTAGVRAPLLLGE